MADTANIEMTTFSEDSDEDIVPQEIEVVKDEQEQEMELEEEKQHKPEKKQRTFFKNLSHKLTSAPTEFKKFLASEEKNTLSFEKEAAAAALLEDGNVDQNIEMSSLLPVRSTKSLLLPVKQEEKVEESFDKKPSRLSFSPGLVKNELATPKSSKPPSKSSFTTLAKVKDTKPADTNASEPKKAKQITLRNLARDDEDKKPFYNPSVEEFDHASKKKSGVLSLNKLDDTDVKKYSEDDKSSDMQPKDKKSEIGNNAIKSLQQLSRDEASKTLKLYEESLDKILSEANVQVEKPKTEGLPIIMEESKAGSSKSFSVETKDTEMNIKASISKQLLQLAKSLENAGLSRSKSGLIKIDETEDKDINIKASISDQLLQLAKALEDDAILSTSKGEDYGVEEILEVEQYLVKDDELNVVDDYIEKEEKETGQEKLTSKGSEIASKPIQTSKRIARVRYGEEEAEEDDDDVGENKPPDKDKPPPQ